MRPVRFLGSTGADLGRLEHQHRRLERGGGHRLLSRPRRGTPRGRGLADGRLADGHGRHRGHGRPALLAAAALACTALACTALPGTALPGTTLPGTALPGTALPGTALPGTGGRLGLRRRARHERRLGRLRHASAAPAQQAATLTAGVPASSVPAGSLAGVRWLILI